MPDFDRVVERAQALGAEIVQPARMNPNSRQMELWVRDPDGYVVVAAGAPDPIGRRRDTEHRGALAAQRAAAAGRTPETATPRRPTSSS